MYNALRMNKNEENVLLKVTAGYSTSLPTILYEGTAAVNWQDKAVVLKYTDDEQVYNQIRFSRTGCLMRRKGKDEIVLRLSTKGKSSIKVDTGYGWLELEAETRMLVMDDNSMRIQYTINGDEEGKIFDFAWEIQGALA